MPRNFLSHPAAWVGNLKTCNNETLLQELMGNLVSRVAVLASYNQASTILALSVPRFALTCSTRRHAHITYPLTSKRATKPKLCDGDPVLATSTEDSEDRNIPTALPMSSMQP